jgi:6-phosphogluconate dehydrogenase
MVHNGIEYGDMQLIAEAYDVLNRALDMSAAELADTFAEWNRGPLESFLIEITAAVFRVADPETGKPLVSLILDQAGQHGPGKWTAQAGLELSIPVPTIAAAIAARLLSGLKDERVIASRLLKSSAAYCYSGEKRELIAAVHDALYAGKICCYAQGMSLVRAASLEWQWDVPLRELARVWKGGCIIRARFLNAMMQAYDTQPELPNLLLDAEFLSALRRAENGWRKVVATAAEIGIPVPAFAASLAYFDSYRSEHLPQNLTQAQRDYFGAHKYQRADRPSAGFVHTDWAKLLPKSTRTGAKQ